MDALDAMETDVLNNFAASIDNIMDYKSEVDVSTLKTQIIEPIKDEAMDEPQAKRGRRGAPEELEGELNLLVVNIENTKIYFFLPLFPR